jgi:hypothetical protein
MAWAFASVSVKFEVRLNVHACNPICGNPAALGYAAKVWPPMRNAAAASRIVQ